MRTREMLRHYLREEVADYKEETYEAGQLVYAQGEVCDSLCLVLEGQVDVTREETGNNNDNNDGSGGGESVVVEQRAEGDFFPLGVLGTRTEDGAARLRTHTRGATVRATVPTRVARVNGKDFRAFAASMRSKDRGEVVDDLEDDVFQRHEQRAQRGGFSAKLDPK